MAYHCELASDWDKVSTCHGADGSAVSFVLGEEHGGVAEEQHTATTGQEEEHRPHLTPMEEQVDRAQKQAQTMHEKAEAEAHSRLKQECGRLQIEAENVSGDEGPCGQIAIEANGGERR
jgi:hypothetical protein